MYYFEVISLIYFDNAATGGKKPPEVTQAVVEGLTRYSANPGRGGHALSVNAGQKVFEVRGLISQYFGAKNENSICFTSGCTASLNTVIYGCLNKGDHVLISSLEHNAVLRPLVALKSEGIIDYDIVPINVFHPESAPADFEKAIKPNTRMIIVTHASNVTGTVLPINEIGSICKKHNILFTVDAAQSAGYVPINVKEMNIDYLCIAPHKGLFAPMGVGVLIAENKIEKVLIKGGTGVNSLSKTQPEELPERVESGTVNLPGILGVGAGIKFLKRLNSNIIKEKEMSILRHIYDGLAYLGAEFYAPYPEEEKSVSLLSFNLKEKNSEQVASYLSEHNIAVRGGLHCSPLAHETIGTTNRGTVRISLSPFNNKNDADYFLKIVKKIAN